jgi:hypothetical protein
LRGAGHNLHGLNFLNGWNGSSRSNNSSRLTSLAPEILRVKCGGCE